ncbi:uncharacterized protein LOC123524773 [Mercenaria mercenaria]|uniref:uncharacterized protein LOC123524773 n=1 Tax=Mercenaria mercenaria TaxID=6596 RepID=UPI00234EE276|nr:uncharacterized protein LOC123524773 [Mercenaria mercenaria]XP_053394465.1 uncharacterized protein LOC123524773 [Mercenaria mercenaria]XP_053394466.1 uncharacterized protein LOC123524773 [Mercenaria mercenaria]XP_053394467.1 uncharacterized protein LOC123524773 [Mercenaria mercenaria]
MSGKSKEELLSYLLYTTLDTVGFQRECVSFRSKAYKQVYEHLTSNIAKYEIPLTHLCVGSSGEGTALRGSDADVMAIITDSICVDNANESGCFTLLETDYTNTAPGYTKVLLAKLDEESLFHFAFDNSQMYTSSAGRAYISSAIFRNFIYQSVQASSVSAYSYESDENENENTTTNGPAATKTIGTQFSFDYVSAVYFYGNIHLRDWTDRVRYHNWPSTDLIKEISQMEGYIVPVGNKFSDTRNIEWRICYTTAELKLVASLNDVQVKLYVLLKMVAKEILKPFCKVISSYIVKNVIFWMVETQSEQQFSPNSLVNLLQKSMIFIKYCLENNHFPNYMIPERNMLGVAVDYQEKQQTIRFLSTCLGNVESIIFMIPKLLLCMNHISNLPNRELYLDLRNEIEKLSITSAVYTLEHYDLGMMSRRTLLLDLEWEYYKDEKYWESWIKLYNLVVPEWIDLILTGKTEKITELFYFRLRAMPSL